jgi:flavodoxin
MKAIVIYFSVSGRTKKVAEAIATELGNYEVDIEAITSEKKSMALIKEKERILAGDLSDFIYSENILDLSPYDLVCIGVPVWGGRPAFVFNAFIQKIEGLNGKNAVVFTTCRFYPGKTLAQMKSEIEKKGGSVINQKSFRALFSMGEKKAREFGKIINQ